MKRQLNCVLMRFIAFTATSCAVVLLLNMHQAAAVTRSSSPSAPVLLTFDVEANDDVPALQKLALALPATYFVAGQFAEDHAETVRALAADAHNTVGSRSYAQTDLTKLDASEIKKDLLLSKLLLRDATGRAPRWFRAPFLEVDENVAAAMKEVGFTHDSSNRERWMTAPSMVELPISSGPGMLASDYEIFVEHRLSDEAARAWLIERYQERALLGRPFVLLMHPRIIAEHAGVFAAFIEHAAGRGASFLSADAYMTQLEQRAAGSLGAWINLSGGPHSARQTAEDLKAAGISQAFLMAKDPEGNRHFAIGAPQPGKDDPFGQMLRHLKEAGVRVHAWLPVLSDPKMAQSHPELAMIGRDGKPSPDWLSPSNPDARAHIVETIRTLIANYEIDGIHLDYLRYPDLEHDYGTAALEGFEAWSGLRHVAVQSLLTENYNRWTDWRAQEIARLAATIREEMRRATDRKIVLSAALIGDAALNYRSVEKYGQSYSDLAPHLDWVIPMAYFHGDRQPVEWIGRVVRAARFRIGDTKLLIGLEAYQEPGAWRFDKALFERSIRQARPGSDGIVLYPYLHLFARGGSGRDMPPDSIDALAAFRELGSGAARQ
jgi:peptidoglycan/xylan/chitin deacetylase (PgdA/CDA1 family)